MDTLQLQDAFQPYYAERPHTQDDKQSTRLEGGAESETKARLELCRARLARAIAASEAERP